MTMLDFSTHPCIKTTDLWIISTKIEPQAKNTCHKNFTFCRLKHAMCIVALTLSLVYVLNNVIP